MSAADATADVAAGKPLAAFRVYDKAADPGVFEHYKQLRTNQTLAFSRAQRAKWTASWGARPGGRMTVREALAKCDSFVDRSDPDTSLPNSLHMLQAAEAARAAGREDWFILAALVHDIGKLMYLWGSPADGQGGRADEPQWALGGDTFVVGEPLPACAVYPELNALNPDEKDAAVAAGIYAPRAGVMQLEYSFGHDEYAYMWALHNKVKMPLAGLAILRLHSCYPWHTGGAYAHLEAEGDEALKGAARRARAVRRARAEPARGALSTPPLPSTPFPSRRARL
jgi:inositol oxygenase